MKPYFTIFLAFPCLFMFTGEYHMHVRFLNQAVVISAWVTRTKVHLPALMIVTHDQQALQPTFAGHCYLHELPLQHMISLYITWAAIERTCDDIKQGDIIAYHVILRMSLVNTNLVKKTLKKDCIRKTCWSCYLLTCPMHYHNLLLKVWGV